jgi:hypothetical protein
MRKNQDVKVRQKQRYHRQTEGGSFHALFNYAAATAEFIQRQMA